MSNPLYIYLHRYAGLTLPAQGMISGYSKVTFEVTFEPVAPGEVELELDVKFLVKENGYRDVKVGSIG